MTINGWMVSFSGLTVAMLVSACAGSSGSSSPAAVPETASCAQLESFSSPGITGYTQVGNQLFAVNSQGQELAVPPGETALDFSACQDQLGQWKDGRSHEGDNRDHDRDRDHRRH